MSDDLRDEPVAAADEPEAVKPEAPLPKAFIGGLSEKITDKDLRRAFEDFGCVEATVMMDKFTDRSRGFGFAIFEDEQGLETAIKERHDSTLDDRKISVRKAVPQSQCKPGTPGGAIGRRDGGRDYRRDGHRGYERDSRGPYGGYESRGYDRDRYDPRDRYDRGGYEPR